MSDDRQKHILRDNNKTDWILSAGRSAVQRRDALRHARGTEDNGFPRALRQEQKEHFLGRALKQIAHRVAQGPPIGRICWIRGLCYV